MTSTPTKPLTLTSLVGCRHTVAHLKHHRPRYQLRVHLQFQAIVSTCPNPKDAKRSHDSRCSLDFLLYCFHLLIESEILRRRTGPAISSPSTTPRRLRLKHLRFQVLLALAHLVSPSLKWFLKEITRDIHSVDGEWRIILLRYFNPIGAHESGKLGEDPIGILNNLMPYTQKLSSC